MPILLREAFSWGNLAGSNVYYADTDPADSCPKAEPWEQAGDRGNKIKKQGLAHIWLQAIL
jgi:hypothetical protein